MALKRNYKRNYKRNDAGFCYVTVLLGVSVGVDFMPSPFPGMNPYLEASGVWQEVHKRLIVAIADMLNPVLHPHYRVAIEERVYQTTGEDSLLVGIPDNVVVKQSQTVVNKPSANVGVASLVQPVTVTLPMPETVKEWFLEVRQAGTGHVVTVVELLSPKNKRSGEGRQQYDTKRQKILPSLTHLVEIDLLRQGKPMPMECNGIKSDYRILVSRSNRRPLADLYAFNLRDPIPSFPLPLRSPNSPDHESTVTEPTIHLQTLLHELYDRGSYDLLIDYSRDPLPRLSSNDAVWMDNLLREKQLR